MRNDIFSRHRDISPEFIMDPISCANFEQKPSAHDTGRIKGFIGKTSKI